MYVLLTYPLVPLVPWLLGFHQVLGVLCVPWHLGILVLHQLLGRHQVHRILWLPVVPLVLDVRQVQLVLQKKEALKLAISLTFIGALWNAIMSVVI